MFVITRGIQALPVAIPPTRNDEECLMEKKGSSLRELRDAGAASKIMSAQDATV
jgi:hypothetical protein